MEQLQMVADLWRMVLRRLPLIVTVAVMGVAATLFLAYILPARYQSEARILVERQQIPDELARSTVTAGVAERLQQIQQRLMARDNVLRMIDEMRLFVDRPDLTLTEKIQRFRWATQFKTIQAPKASRYQRNVDISAFTIKITYTDPRKAANIANAFVTQVLALNLGVRKELASETLGFFISEERRLSRALAEIEAEITGFKKANEERLPESLNYRRDELSRLADSMLETDRQILELEAKRGELAAQLSEVAVIAPVAQSTEERELRQLRALLVQKRAIFAENHREIRALKARIAALEASLPAIRTGGTETAADARTIREQSLREQIALIDTQTQTLEDAKAGAAARQGEILGSIEETPKVEMRLTVLNRRHKELQDQYAAIVRKRAEAETGERLEVNQQAERFEVIENALVAERPISPNRRKIAVMGSAASLGLALGLAFLLDLLRPVIRSPAQMQRQLDLRPVISIPMVSTRSERRRSWARLILLVVVLVVAIPGGLYLIDQKVMPLALVGEKLAEKSGFNEFLRLVERRF